MKIRLAERAESETVFRIREEAITAAYPKYYPQGAVEWFLSPDNRGYITVDVDSDKVYVLETEAGIVGTVTVDGDELQRLFVLPREQGKGYGRALVDAALCARKFYEKLGYTFASAEEFPAKNGDVICWNIMEKKK